MRHEVHAFLFRVGARSPEGIELKTQVIALLLMGRRPEPYLPAVLASIDRAVDFVVVNDNGGDRSSANRQALEASSLFVSGRVGIVEAPFEGFSRARNLCLDFIRRHGIQQPGAATWLMTVDCDEVHDPDLESLTRTVLPCLSPRIGIVDGYFVQFMQSYDYFISLDRRHNLLFRLNDDVQWYLDVHERIDGLRGQRLCLPYIYYHYGYVMSNQQILDKWQHYQALGDPTYSPEELRTVDIPRMFAHEIARCMPYTWGHPPALRMVGDALYQVPDPSIQAFREAAAAHLRQPAQHVKAWLRRSNYRIRVFWRAIQAAFCGVHWRALPAVLTMAL